MIDVFGVAELLVERVVKNYGQQVDIIAYHGSYARDEARDDSDLDIFYIPANGKKLPINSTFLIDGVLFDFWAIDWNTMAGFATGEIRGWAFAPALVQHTKVLYARAERHAIRIEELKQQTLDLQKPEARSLMIGRALRKFTNVLAHVENTRLAVADANLTDTRCTGWKVVQSTFECLALANQIFFNRGLANALTETARFEEKPPGMKKSIKTITTSPNLNKILKASEKLALETRKVLRRVQQSDLSITSDHMHFQQFYPEMRDKINKLVAACDRGDAIAAHAEAMMLQHEVTSALDRTKTITGHNEFNLRSEFADRFTELEFPDLMAFTGNSLQELASQAGIFDERLRRFLGGQSIDLFEYKNLEELKQTLQSDG